MAGSNFAVEMLGAMREQHKGEPLGNFASTILPEIEQDREVLRGLIEHVGSGDADLKEAAAWLSEKVSRFKPGRDQGQGAGTFEALETLAPGIQGKWSLWRALLVISEEDDRVRGVDYHQPGKRAEEQHRRVEEHRSRVARQVFREPVPH